MFDEHNQQFLDIITKCMNVTVAMYDSIPFAHKSTIIPQCQLDFLNITSVKSRKTQKEKKKKICINNGQLRYRGGHKPPGPILS